MVLFDPAAINIQERGKLEKSFRYSLQDGPLKVEDAELEGLRSS